MTRRDSIDRIVDNVAHRGSANEQAAGKVLAALFRDALAEEDAHAAANHGYTVLDPRKVLIGVMKNMRAAMAEVRDELDAMDGVGKYR